MEKNFGGLLYNKRKIIKELVNEFPNIGKAKDFKIDGPVNDIAIYAEGKPLKLDSKDDSWRSTFNFTSPDKKKYSILMDGKTRREIKNEIKGQIVSKEFQDRGDIKDFKNDLKERLYTKLGKQHVEDRGGIDAYIRGYFSPEYKYQAYKSDMNFLPLGHFEAYKSVFKK